MKETPDAITTGNPEARPFFRGMAGFILFFLVFGLAVGLVIAAFHPDWKLLVWLLLGALSVRTFYRIWRYGRL